MKSFLLLRFLLLLAAGSAVALAQGQQRQGAIILGGMQGMGGQGGQGTGGANAANSRQYLNSTMLGDALITSDPTTRRLIVVADDQTNESIKTIISQLDKPKPQVLINVVFLQVTHGESLDLGAEGKFFRQYGGGAGSSGTAQTNFGLATAGLAGGFYKYLSADLDATLYALAVSGKTEILSRPSILARSSQQATIMVGQEVPFITNSRVTDTGQTVNTVSYQDIGIILRVTPFITQDGLVEMIVAPEISSLSDRTVPISDTANTPVIDKRSADTVVVTPSDKTIVIGGLIDNQVTTQDRKVPLLGDIPLLGALFKRKVKTDNKTELLIFLTPHVVMRPEDLSHVADEERAKLNFAPKTFDKKEMDRYLQPSTPAAGVKAQ
jgi:general secretion pathway protein D